MLCRELKYKSKEKDMQRVCSVETNPTVVYIKTARKQLKMSIKEKHRLSHFAGADNFEHYFQVDV